MKNCFLLRVRGLIIAYIILLPSERDTGHNLRHKGHSYQLVTWFVIILALLGVALLFVSDSL